MKQIIAVTGATGFIGQSICRRLSEHHYAVRALVRSPHAALPPALSNVEIIAGDLDNQAGLNRLITGAEAIVHCAGRVRGAAKNQFDQVNVEGTGNLLQAIKAHANSPRLLCISSLAAREPQLSFYASSKREAEQLLQSEGPGVDWAIIRPPAVYGPGDRELLPIFRLMARGIALPAGTSKARVSMLYVEDLSAAIIAWLRSDTNVEGIFTLDDGQSGGYDWHDISKIVGQLCERKIRIVRPPAWLLDIPASINSRIGIAFGTSPMLTPQKLRELRHPDWVCDSAEFQRAYDWSPKFRLAEGLQATPDWPGHRRNAPAPAPK